MVFINVESFLILTDYFNNRTLIWRSSHSRLHKQQDSGQETTTLIFSTLNFLWSSLILLYVAFRIVGNSLNYNILNIHDGFSNFFPSYIRCINLPRNLWHHLSWITDSKLSSKTAFSACTMPISYISLNEFLHVSYFYRTLGGPGVGRDCTITENFYLVNMWFWEVISTENPDIFHKM